MSLRVRLGLVFALGTAALIGAVGLLFLVQLRSSLDATVDVGLRGRSETISEQIAAEGVASLRLSSDDQPVQVMTPDGRVLASSPDLGRVPVLDPGRRDRVVASSRAGGGPTLFTTGPDDEHVRFAAALLPRSDLLLVVGADTGVADAAHENVEKGFLLLGPPSVLVAGIGAWWLAGQALRPVERMRRQTAEMSDRDDGGHLAVPRTRDELAALATTMNDLLDRLRTALAHERSFVADAGHELRTPLATLRAELELAARPGRDREELHAAVVAAGGETDRLIRLAEDLLLLAGAGDEHAFLRVVATDLVEVAAASARGAELLGGARKIDVVVQAPPSAVVPADPDRVRQALDNMLSNAVRHSPDHGTIEIDVVPGPSAVTVTVSDAGSGFPDEFLPHAFERFRRSDDARARADGGTGLGLAIVETIVLAHRGRVRATNRPTGGAAVEIELPTDDPSAPHRRGPEVTTAIGRTSSHR